MWKLFAAAALFTAASATDNIVLYHRIYHPDLPAHPYAERATFSLSSSTLIPSPSLAEDLASFSESLENLDGEVEPLYQIAVAREDDSSDAFWDFSSVKACYLGRATSETILLHFASSPDEQPFAIDYFVSPIPKDGSCPLTKSKKRSINASSGLKTFSDKALHLNSTVLVRRPETPPSPELKAPPPLTPQGEVVKPVPERTFLQKYWMYIGAFVLVLLVSSGPEEPERSRRGGEGN